MSFSKHRLQKDRDFERIFKNGRAFKNKLLFLKVITNNLSFSRFGFVVGKKVSLRATTRNLIRRRLRESLRKKIEKIKPGFDAVIIPDPEITKASYKIIDQAILEILNKAKLI